MSSSLRRVQERQNCLADMRTWFYASNRNSIGCVLERGIHRSHLRLGPRREMHVKLHHAPIDLKKGTRQRMHSSDGGAFASIIPTKVRSRRHHRDARGDADTESSHTRATGEPFSPRRSCHAERRNGVKSRWRTRQTWGAIKFSFFIPSGIMCSHMFCRPGPRDFYYPCHPHRETRHYAIKVEERKKKINETPKIERGLKSYVSSVTALCAFEHTRESVCLSPTGSYLRPGGDTLRRCRCTYAFTFLHICLGCVVNPLR